ncbi:uncharacterized protein LOC143914206 isoform X1 [Arctopsyche grandis]|uniref:uncharacterized protein LOC143914206 isoform X1 n=1 Tax=Arctopsyche grandis TaxID=121162 RepID=UPI00406D6AA9
MEATYGSVYKKLALMCSLVMMGLVKDSDSAPLDIASDSQTLARILWKRSPIFIEVEHTTASDLPTQHNLYDSTISHNGGEPLSLSTSSIKTSSTLLRGPSVSGSAVINLVDHQIVQTHDHPYKVHTAEDVLHTLSDVDVIHPNAHALSTSRKTTITTNVGHVVDEKGITPVVTHDITHIHESVAHVTEDEEHLRVLPLQAVVITTREPEHIVSVPNHENKVSHSHEATKDKGRKHRRRNIYREAVGGYGIGYRYGGQGAGHGYYVNF